MSKTSLALSSLIGVLLGVAGSFAVLSRQVARQNGSLTCESWQVRDDYRSTVFGRVAYCRDLPIKSIPW